MFSESYYGLIHCIITLMHSQILQCNGISLHGTRTVYLTDDRYNLLTTCHMILI